MAGRPRPGRSLIRIEVRLMAARDRDAQLRNLIAGYGDSIRLSDIKANIAVLFVAIMMGTVLQFRAQYPLYLSAPVILAPFIVMFLNLLVSVYPRYPRVGRKRFPVWRDADPDAFDFIADTALDAAELPVRCALLSRTLYWKNVTLQAAYLIAMATLFAGGVLLFVAWLKR